MASFVNARAAILAARACLTERFLSHTEDRFEKKRAGEKASAKKVEKRKSAECEKIRENTFYLPIPIDKGQVFVI